jgi:GR25 family glycosyltransferase involved in LPS biosynthesis
MASNINGKFQISSNNKTINKVGSNLISLFIPVLIIIVIILFLVPSVVSFLKSKPITEEFVVEIIPRPFTKCYVINLTQTKEGQRRWKEIQQHPQVKDFVVRFPGIYGKNYDYRQLVKQGVLTETWDYGRWNGGISKVVKMSLGEIGCLLSHYYVWKKIVEQRIPITLILEDDASNIQNNFIGVISDEMKHLPQGWDIFLVGYWLHTGDIGTKVNSHIYKVGNFALLHSYIITLTGAKKLLQQLPINMPIDSWLSSKSKQINIYRHNLTRTPNSKYPSSRVIRQKPKISEIIHTNNWIR